MTTLHSVPVHLALIQASPFCNIDCKYCYLPDRATPKRMTTSKLEEVYQFLFRDPSQLSNRLRILWHAGEPMAVPISFYEEALSIQRRVCPPHIEVTNSIQTNATLLSDSWVEFLKSSGTVIGVSFDGPARFHDANRVTRNGEGTFEKVRSGILKLVEARLPFHVITVLNDRSLDCPVEMWKTYRELGISRIHFLIEELQGLHTIRELRRGQLQARLEAFFSVFDDCRRRSGADVYVRELDDNAAKLTALTHTYKEIEQVPLGILSISYTGDVATFSPELLGSSSAAHGRFVFGNTQVNTLQEITTHPSFQSAYRSILRGYARCKATCPYYDLCGGGQPSIKLYENGSFDSTETPSCQMRIKAPIQVLLRREPGIACNGFTDSIARRLAAIADADHSPVHDRC